MVGCGVGQRRRMGKSAGSTARRGPGSAERDAATAVSAGDIDIARIDSLEEITEWLGTFRERLRQARATERIHFAALVDSLEDQYRLRRAELS